LELWHNACNAPPIPFGRDWIERFVLLRQKNPIQTDNSKLI
jgi:hypothetical protein